MVLAGDFQVLIRDHGDDQRGDEENPVEEDAEVVHQDGAVKTVQGGAGPAGGKVQMLPEQPDAGADFAHHHEQQQPAALPRAAEEDGVEGVEQQNEDQKDANGHNDREPLHCALLILEFPAPGHEPAARQGNFCNPRLHIGDHTAHVTAFDEDANGRQAGIIFAADIYAATGFPERGDLFERDVQAVRRVHENLLQVGQAALGLGQAHNDTEVFFAFP